MWSLWWELRRGRQEGRIVVLELIGDGWQWAQDRIQHLAVTDVELSQQ